MDIAVDSTVPVGAGLSSSAALECSVAVALASLLDLPLDADGRRALAAACMRAESEVAGAPTGGMDQTVSLLAEEGSALLIDFDDDETAQVAFPIAAAGLALLVTDTRVSHALVEGGYGDRRAECDAAARLLGVASLRHATLGDVEALADDLCSAGPGTSSPRSPGGAFGRRRSRPATGHAWDGFSTSRTSRCATTSRSPAPSSTSPSRPPSRPARSGPG